MVATILLACGVWTLVRTDGITGDGGSELAWRWTPTPEERLLAQAGDEPVAPPPAPVAPEPTGQPVAARTGDEPRSAPADARRRKYASQADRSPGGERSGAGSADCRGRQHEGPWPGFRGPDRDGVVRGVPIETDWSASPPVAAVAPADRTGLVVLRGPRRPPLHAGAARRRRDRLLLQADHRRAGVEAPRRGPVLGVERRRRSARDADPQQRSRLHIRRDRNPERARRRDGAVVWSRNAASDTGTEGPGLGLRELAAGGRRRRHRRRLRHARRPTTSPPAIRAGSARPAAASYSSPQLATIDGVAQVLLLSGRRRDERRAGRRHAALGARVAGHRHRAAGADRGRRRPDQHHRRHGRRSARAASRSRTAPADGPSRSAGRRTG